MRNIILLYKKITYMFLNSNIAISQYQITDQPEFQNI